MEDPMRQLVTAVSPFGTPNADLVVAACRSGSLGVLDVGDDPAKAREAVRRVAERTDQAFGLRIGARSGLTAEELWELVAVAGDGRVDTLIIGVDPADVAGSVRRQLDPAGRPGEGPRLLAEVTSVTQARAAVEAGAAGLIAKGSESGGAVGEETAFVLLQATVDAVDVPVWSQGGIGLHTAAAAVVGGAEGVVLDVQLALTVESSLPAPLRIALGAMDGSETVVLGGHRVLTRPDLPAASLRSDADAAEVAPLVGGTDLYGGLVAVGQDGALARPLADRYRTVGGVIQAVRSSIIESRSAARRQGALDPGSALARDLGTRYPIAQGPMTRVSDRPEFASAVAAGGGLPFLALALLRGDEVRTLLRQTAEQVGDGPWGAGILGFVPPELRDEQMAVLLEQPPPVALIAGGRPSQARPLEEAGTEVFLHVPSPGLLDRFLADGARRFVFEGRECGGHVGPRSSFALWEAQLDRLLAFDHPEELRLLFAGGIHDARSAAMVAAMAAPLVERGAAIGTLMGTAYLLTEEAVTSGAIQPAFQQAALEADTTVLLETSPGHATRCVDSAFVQTFAAERRRLVEAGTSTKEMWAELEMLNLGRLRIASKGLRRDGESIGTVSSDEQRRHGMYMMGQVAALRRQVTTVEELHADVSEGVAAVLDRSNAADRAVAPVSVGATAEPPRQRVAIVGMSAIFPGADGLESYWANVVAGKNSITEVPPERWDIDTYYDPDSFSDGAGRRTPSKWGGFLPEVGFDALAYGIPPTSLASIDPVQLLSLEVASRALADAGYAQRRFDRRAVSVIFGAEAGTDLAGAYGFRAMYPQTVGKLPDGLEETLPVLTEDSFPGVLTNVIAGRIANRLDLGGVNYTVDAACASSLAAVDMACKELLGGTSDMVLCGGADLHNGINDYLLFAGVHALSPTGQCRSFDAEADGIALGEGVACIVLKRLEDAERDGDRVYAVVDGIAGSSDGRSLGLTAPRPEGQRRALERAYRHAGISPAEVGLVEAHGTGTVVGDRTELTTLNDLFLEAGAEVASVALGSVKSQIGHTKCAAGMAGLIKAALALHRGVRPPTLNVSQPNPGYQTGISPFVFDESARPWPSGRRVAGVSAFGFGGTNFHAVLSAHHGDDVPSHGLEEWPAELFLFTGVDRGAALAQADRLESLIEGAPDRDALRLRDLAATVADWGRPGRSGARLSVQVAVVAADLAELRSGLAMAREGRSAPKAGVFVADGGEPSPVAFLYPGQGSQRPGMLADLFVAFPPLQRRLRQGEAWVDRMFPPTPFGKDEQSAQREALTDTRVAQPALGIAGLAVTELLASCGVRPDLVGGHSYGELVALAVAGALPEDELLALSETRGRVMVGAAGDDPGTMAAVAASSDAVGQVLAGIDPQAIAGVVVANDNSPTQVVVSGPTPAMERAVEALDDAGMACRRLSVACAFHSSVVAAAETEFASALAPMDVRPPDIPVYANVTAAPYPPEPEGIRQLLSRQLASPVRFRQQIEAMYEAGARVFVEAGSGRVLSQLTSRILDDRPHTAVACDVAGDDGVTRFLLALGQLATLGVPVDPSRLFEGRATTVEATSLPRRPGWTVNGQLVRTAAGAVVAGGLLPAQETALPAGSPIVGGERVGDGQVGAGQVRDGPDDRDAAVLSYLQSMRELVQAQRDVFLTYLGSQPGGSPVSGSGSAATASPVLFPASEPAPVAPEPPAVIAAQPTAAVDADQVMAMLLALVGERTGYPEDMLGPDLDLEADLSIDSIKRLEIIGELADRAGFGTGQGGDGSLDESVVEELVTQKSLRSIVDWIVDHLLGAPDGGTPDEASAPAGSSDARARTLSGDELMALLLALVGERTGYPEDMLGPDLDLEADLSIDSIKRLEILGELADRAGFGTGEASGGLDESVVEELVAQKSLRSIVAWVEGHLSGVTAPPTVDADQENGRTASQPGIPGRSVRAVFRVVPAPAMVQLDSRLAGATMVVIDDGSGVTSPLAARLRDCGARVEICARGQDPTEMVEAAGAGTIDGLIYLALDPADGEQVPQVFESVRGTALTRPRWLVALTGLGGSSGRGPEGAMAPPPPGSAGMAGMWRALAREIPEGVVRLVDVDPSLDPAAIVDVVADELNVASGPVVVGYRRGQRVTVVAVEEELAPGSLDRSPVLDGDSVVLLTGGGRGITARLAVSLATRTGCAIELVGRSPLPDAPEQEEVAGAEDVTALRRVLVGRGMRSPSEIEALCARLLAAREIRATLSALEAAGVKVRYHEADVRDPEALTTVVEDVYGRHGRLDGVVHGAGVIEDRLLVDKTPDSFRRVFDTKVVGGAALVGALRDDRPFVVFFTSVSGAFGNRGQVDYGAANDALATLAWSLDSQRRPGSGRVLAVDWGPWAETGMVSPELEREYAGRGVGLVAADDGIERLMDELSVAGGEPEVVVARARVEVFEPPVRELVNDGSS
jgi:acyl transferase domain-containing protein/NAD(P)H-dependent flavin oxidoreductase YrpB (nitropropane dioxygenase family)/acyl carrier protein